MVDEIGPVGERGGEVKDCMNNYKMGKELRLY